MSDQCTQHVAQLEAQLAELNLLHACNVDINRKLRLSKKTLKAKVSQLEAQVKLSDGLAAGWKQTADRLEAQVAALTHLVTNAADPALMQENAQLKAQVAELTEACDCDKLCESMCELEAALKKIIQYQEVMSEGCDQGDYDEEDRGRDGMWNAIVDAKALIQESE